MPRKDLHDYTQEGQQTHLVRTGLNRFHFYVLWFSTFITNRIKHVVVCKIHCVMATYSYFFLLHQYSVISAWIMKSLQRSGTEIQGQENFTAFSTRFFFERPEVVQQIPGSASGSFAGCQSEEEDQSWPMWKDSSQASTERFLHCYHFICAQEIPLSRPWFHPEKVSSSFWHPLQVV